MEKNYGDSYYIIKNPTIICDITIILKNPNIKIKAIIIPIRDYELSAISRTKHGKNCGGLVNAIDKESQIIYYNKIMAEYIYYMTKYDINTIFIDFDKMISDKLYLFNKLKFILNDNNINFDIFSYIYDEASVSSKPTIHE